MEYESGPDSQPNTVGWDNTTPSQKDSFESRSKQQRVNTDPKLDGPSENQKVNETNAESEKPIENNREETGKNIRRLGGELTVLDEEEEGNTPPAKTGGYLDCITAGFWKLHTKHVDRSAATRGFLPTAGGATVPEPKPIIKQPHPQQSIIVPAEVDEQPQRLNVVLTGRETPRRASRLTDRPTSLQRDKPDMEYESGPDSQPNTVGWDNTTPSQKDSFESRSKQQRVNTDPKLDGPSENQKVYEAKAESEKPIENPKVNVPALNNNRVPNTSMMEVGIADDSRSKAKEIGAQTEVKAFKRFMLSSDIDNHKETIIYMMESLGGELSYWDDKEGNSPTATHLLCCAPERKLQLLCAIAAGLWVCHPAFVERSVAAGGFLPEESFEWGNPSATCLPPVSGGEQVLAVAAHRWRSRRQRGQPGPFAGVVALLHVPASKRRLLARLVRSGQGAVVDEQPPYTDESITVCFADPKSYPMKERDRAWLASRRVPVCASILLSAFLTEENRPDLNQHCIPEFKA